MHRHQEVVLVGISEGLPPSLQLGAARQLQLTGATAGKLFVSDDHCATHVRLLHGQDTEVGILSGTCGGKQFFCQTCFQKKL